MCYVLCMFVMKHVGQDELRMSLQFTLRLCDSLRLSSGWLNPPPPHPPLGLTHRDLLQMCIVHVVQKNLFWGLNAGQFINYLYTIFDFTSVLL